MADTVFFKEYGDVSLQSFFDNEKMCKEYVDKLQIITPFKYQCFIGGTEVPLRKWFKAVYFFIRHGYLLPDKIAMYADVPEETACGMVHLIKAAKESAAVKGTYDQKFEAIVLQILNINYGKRTDSARLHC